MRLTTKPQTFKTGEELVTEVQRLYRLSKKTVILVTTEAAEVIVKANNGISTVEPTFCERWQRLKTIYITDNDEMKLVEFEKPYDVEMIYLFDV